jgi:hypothetical protein
MTEEQRGRAVKMVEETERNLPLVQHIPEPFRLSVAKYYSALKRLAEE